MQFRDPCVIIGARADGGVQLVVIGNIVTMQSVRARLKIRRCIHVTNPQRVQIGHDLARLRKGEPAIELQPVGASWNARMSPVGHVEWNRDTSSNDEIRMTNDETNPNDEIRNGALIAAASMVIRTWLFIRHSTFVVRHFPVTSSPAP